MNRQFGRPMQPFMKRSGSGRSRTGIYFRQIFSFHASGTGMTQGGLVAGQKAASGQEQIIGISVARNAARGAVEVARFAGVPVDQVCFLDEYLCGGYGKYEEEIERTIEHVMEQYGIPLDPTYTEKPLPA